MKGEKKEYQNKKRLYLLGLCGVLAISGTVYAVTRKSEPQKEQKELVDLNDEGQGVPDEVRDIAQEDSAILNQPDKSADGGEKGHKDQIAAGPTPSQPTEQQLTADGTQGLNKPNQQDHTKPTTVPVPTTQTALNQSEEPEKSDGKVAESEQGEKTETKVGKSDAEKTEIKVGKNDAEKTETKVGKNDAEKTEIKVGKNDAESEGIKEGSLVGEQEKPEESAQVNNPTAQELKFSEEDGLRWPLSGNVIKNYSTDKLIYFETLGQFKTNPGIFIAGEKGNPIVAAANGIVKEIKKEDKTGQTLILDIGGGYTLTYGQLEEIAVKPGDYVKDGQEMAKLAKVTKYYRMEGEHLYFQVQKDGENINPLTLIRSE